MKEFEMVLLERVCLSLGFLIYNDLALVFVFRCHVGMGLWEEVEEFEMILLERVIYLFKTWVFMSHVSVMVVSLGSN